MTPDDAPTLEDWLGAGEASALDAADLADLEVAVEAVLAGAREVMRRYRGREAMEVEEKAPDDPVTEADRAADRAIARVLRTRRPGEAIRSEESDDVPAVGPGRGPGAAGATAPEGAGGPGSDAGGPASGHLWIADPLDGTKEFLARNGEFAVMVGLAVEGSARLGAVYRPDPGILYLGTTGGAAWAARLREHRRIAGRGGGEEHRPDDAGRGGGEADRGGGQAGRGGRDAKRADRDDADVAAEVRSLADFRDPTPLSVATAPDGPIRLLHSRSHRPEGLERLAEVLGEVELVPLGSAGLKCSGVAAGAGDLYVHPVPYMMEWDTCAPEAVLRGAGGRVSDCLGEPLRYGKDDPAQTAGLFAGRPDVWERARAVVRELAP